ncbi:pyridoxal-phosphate dependent enzyme [Candidatus Micrarchaeota archaeon]|nr:pyridoxal-phosphate dependent enzyme [Candidatus Micrarchaeota archaeon]MBU1165967.1 pyridoxal-phosphate dependent enzyme [Candidatus Micrarchaeota archaeon]MBU1886871.1 pyridoxal-phosphate dependent enzyme [Candidatus Micrarchaeota archaeon]
MQKLTQRRIETFSKLKESVKVTPLVDLGDNGLIIPNSCRILAKIEFDRGSHPTGSHYDRAFIHLIEDAEIHGIRTPSGKQIPSISTETTNLVEISTGNAGAAFAYACRELGYSCTAILLGGLPPSRSNYLKELGANVIEAPRKDYMAGCKELLGDLLRLRFDACEKRYVTVNHPFNPITTQAMAEIITEATNQYGGAIDYFVGTVGNGSTLLGPSKKFIELHGGSVLVWEPFTSAMAYDLFYPGRFKQLFSVVPGFTDHEMHGAGGPGVPCPFRDQFVLDVNDGHISVPDQNNSIRLVVDSQQIDAYSEALTQIGKKIPSVMGDLINWEGIQKALFDLGFPVGRTSAGSVATALDHAHHVHNATFLVIFYDSIEKY